MGIWDFLGKKVKEEDMGFWDHVDALRWVFMRILGAVGITTVVAFFFKSFLYDSVILGPKNPDFITNRILASIGKKFNIEGLVNSGIEFKLNNMELSGQFMNHMKISFIAGLVLAMPYILYQIWKFIEPALTLKEKKNASGFVFITNALFLVGVLFGYFVISPMSVGFLAQYNLSDQIVNMITLDSYLSLVLMMVLGSGLIFELPVVIYFLARLGIITPKLMRTYRKHAVVILFIVAAVITPSPDVLSMTLVALPLLFLYEISIYVAYRVEVRKIKDL